MQAIAEEVHPVILVHIVVHQQDKEHAVNVDGSNARLRKMHKIKRKQERSEKRILTLMEKPFCKRIQDRHHADAKERANDAPAKGIHAENRNAQHNEHFAQRWM